jgi:cyclopropane-fatty-acyl-phospholipid synthase
MNPLWNALGDTFFKRLTHGCLHVIYPNGNEKHYGDGAGTTIVLHVKHSHFFKRLFLYGDIGFAESYMDEEFECNDLQGLISLAITNASSMGTLSEHEKKMPWFNVMPLFNRMRHALRKNSKTRSQKNISEHYDLSNDFFSLMLDESMMYSAALFENPQTSLYDAQVRKMDHLAQKLKLKEGMRVLEIGSGWGSMATHLASRYGVHVTTLTLSAEQLKHAKERFKTHDVEDRIDILLQDYRDAKGEFDAIISIEMFEAVGREYFDVFFKKCESLLAPHGVMAMQIITMPDHRYDAYCKSTDFIQKYIFPGGHLPSVAKLKEVTQSQTRLSLQHIETFGQDYAKTLQLWSDNFHQKLEHVAHLGFDGYFIRMWQMYLAYCEAAFRTRSIDLVQVVFARELNTKGV